MPRSSGVGSLIPRPEEPPRPLETTLNVLGGLLVLLSVVLFFLSFRRQPKNLLPSALPGEASQPIFSAALPRLERRGSLFLFLLGLVLLFVAALIGAQMPN